MCNNIDESHTPDFEQKKPVTNNVRFHFHNIKNIRKVEYLGMYTQEIETIQKGSSYHKIRIVVILGRR